MWAGYVKDRGAGQGIGSRAERWRLPRLSSVRLGEGKRPPAGMGGAEEEDRGRTEERPTDPGPLLLDHHLQTLWHGLRSKHMFVMHCQHDIMISTVHACVS